MRTTRGAVLAVAAVVCLGFLLGTGPARSQEDGGGGGQLYTAYNIWYEQPTKVWSTNYKKGRLLPAGTKVTIDSQSRKAVRFTADDPSITFTVVFVRNHHPALTADDVFDRLFTEKTFEELTAGFTEAEVEAIRKGKHEVGMSKEAVLVSLGYPPETETPSTDLDAWKYWRHRFATFMVYFDGEGKVERAD